MVSAVQWFVTRKSIEHLYDELSMILNYGKQIQLEFPDLDSWSPQDYEHFFSELMPLAIEQFYTSGKILFQTFPEGCGSHDNKRIDTVDVSGKCYACHYLSPERMVQSTLSKYYAEEHSETLCPAASDMAKRRPKQEQLAAYAEKFLKTLAGLPKSRSELFPVKQTE